MVGLAISCVKTDRFGKDKKIDCDGKYDTCFEAVGIKFGNLGNPETFRDCAGTNAGIEPESGEWFKLYPNDVKANGCMSEEEIKKKLDGRPSEFHGDPQQIRICFCNCECCNQGIPKDSNSCSVKECPKEDERQQNGADKLTDSVQDKIDQGLEGLANVISSGATIHTVPRLDSFYFALKFVLLLCQLGLINVFIQLNSFGFIYANLDEHFQQHSYHN